MEANLWEDELFSTGARFEYIYGRVDVFLCYSAVEDELHVAGAFEFLEDGIVCA